MKRLPATTAAAATLLACCFDPVATAYSTVRPPPTRSSSSPLPPLPLPRSSSSGKEVRSVVSSTPRRPAAVGWRHRVVRKLFFRRGPTTSREQDTAPPLLNMQSSSLAEAVDEVDLRVLDQITMDDLASSTFYHHPPMKMAREAEVATSVKEIDALAEEKISRQHHPRTNAAESSAGTPNGMKKDDERTTIVATNSAAATGSTSSSSRLARWTGKKFEQILSERLNRWSRGSHINMDVRCEPKGKHFLQLVKKGQFQCDATITLDRILFGNIRFSGGRLEAKDFCLNLYSFASTSLPKLQSSPRFPHAFDFYGRNITFTQDDLFESSCIRNGLRRLLTRILKNNGLPVLTVGINSIKILPNGKISCMGQATTRFGPPPIHFEVRSGIGRSSRGHILTFPGLELSINPSLGLFVPVIPEITLDVGHNAQLLDVHVDGQSSKLQVSARVRITPEHTIQLKQYIQTSDAFLASCSVDVGRWLTRIGRFAH